ncbi:MAG: iron-sulfur cluster assembly accessory protein [Myxococcales bacterium]|nr:iron-sulfur cluster assembly accessory protein [Myxococcales bacterium]
MTPKKLLHSDTQGSLHAAPATESDKKSDEGVQADPETVTVTPAAVEEIRRQAAKQETAPKAIRVGLRGGGCSGYTYTFEWDEKAPRDKDTVLAADEVRVYIDYRSMKLLRGTILDYQRTLMNRGFKFHNPNSTGSCGCGESTSF